MSKIIIALIGVAVGVSASHLVGMHPSKTIGNDSHDSAEHGHGAGHAHGHEGVEVDSGVGIPSLEIEAVSDSKDGYNLRIKVDNFVFSPESAGQELVQGQGHAHLYVNDVKIARVYGEWYHLPAEKLHSGSNVVRATLNADDHRSWQMNGQTVYAEVLVTK